MKMETERDLNMKLMSKAIMRKNPNMVIRRLQKDKAFVIYTKVVKDESCWNPYYYYILIDIITEKINPDYFNTIKNLTRFIDDIDKGIEIPESYHLKSMFSSIITRDDKDDILEKLIKFNHREFFNIVNMVVDDYTTKDDVYNLIAMMYKCTDFISNYRKMANLNPSHPHMYDHFKFTLAIMDKYASKDKALVKAITENLYGCKISDRNLDNKYFATIITDYDNLLIKKSCYECEDIITNPGSFILYYLALAIYHIPRWNANNDDKDIIENTKDKCYRYLKGEYTPYTSFNFSNPNTTHSSVDFEKYLIPIVWFNLEKINYITAKLVNIRCNHCGKSLAVFG